MAELFKNIYNDAFFAGFTRALQKTVPGFSKANFLTQIYDEDWDNRELKQRMRHISTVLNDHLSGVYIAKKPMAVCPKWHSRSAKKIMRAAQPLSSTKNSPLN